MQLRGWFRRHHDTDQVGAGAGSDAPGGASRADVQRPGEAGDRSGPQCNDRTGTQQNDRTDTQRHGTTGAQEIGTTGAQEIGRAGGPGSGGAGAGGSTYAAVERCELCGADLADGRVCGLVADPTVVRPTEPSLNGLRLLTACTREHLLELNGHYQHGGATGTRSATDLAGNRR
jgi:hypothetical protein